MLAAELNPVLEALADEGLADSVTVVLVGSGARGVRNPAQRHRRSRSVRRRPQDSTEASGRRASPARQPFAVLEAAGGRRRLSGLGATLRNALARPRRLVGRTRRRRDRSPPTGRTGGRRWSMQRSAVGWPLNCSKLGTWTRRPRSSCSRPAHVVRAILLKEGVFPLSRPELPPQLEDIDSGLAGLLAELMDGEMDDPDLRSGCALLRQRIEALR